MDANAIEELTSGGGWDWKSLVEGKLPAVANVCIHILVALVAYWIGRRVITWLLRFLRKSFERGNMEEGVAAFLSSVIKFSLYFVLILLIFQFLGLETSSVVALLGSAGLAVGLALQGSLANFAGGVLILLTKPFLVGDYIMVGDKEGTVVSIDIIYTKLQMIDNKIVIMPNGSLADSNIINVTQQDKRRIDIGVGVSYAENIKRVRDVLDGIIQEQDAVLRDEPIDIVVSELGSSAVEMAVHVWVKKEDYWQVRWAMLEEIKERFDEEGIEIPFDQLDVTLKGVDESANGGKK